MIARFTLNYKLAFLLILGVPRGPARRISKAKSIVTYSVTSGYHLERSRLVFTTLLGYEFIPRSFFNV